MDVQVQGKCFGVDTGFMVFNRQTYPNFCRLLELLRVPSRASDMTFSVRCDETGLEYQGGTLNGLFTQRKNILRPAFWGMLSDILRLASHPIEEGYGIRIACSNSLATATLGRQ